MSGIAEVLINHGYDVSGSDLRESAITQRLVGMGAKVNYPQRAENVENVEVVVISSAIKKGNPELDRARELGLPVVRRAEMLAELMRLKRMGKPRRPRWWRRCWIMVELTPRS